MLRLALGSNTRNEVVTRVGDLWVRGTTGAEVPLPNDVIGLPVHSDHAAAKVGLSEGGSPTVTGAGRPVMRQVYPESRGWSGPNMT